MPKVQLDSGAIKEARAFKFVAGSNIALSSEEGDNDELVITFDAGEADTDLAAHTGDTTAAHAASAISAVSTTLVGVATDVQGVLEELDNGIADHLADTAGAHAASAISADSTTLVGVGTDVQAVLEELDNGIADHLADTEGAHNASAIAVDSTTLVGVGVTAQAVFEELDDAIAALGAALLSRRISFTETAGAGTWTGTVAIPAGGVIHSVAWETSAAWDADTTLLDVGYTGSLTAYGDDINVDGVGGDQVFGLDTEDPDDFDAGTTFTAAITTTGAGGTTGRSMVTVVYSVPPAATAATKA